MKKKGNVWGCRAPHIIRGAQPPSQEVSNSVTSLRDLGRLVSHNIDFYHNCGPFLRLQFLACFLQFPGYLCSSLSILGSGFLKSCILKILKITAFHSIYLPNLKPLVSVGPSSLLCGCRGFLHIMMMYTVYIKGFSQHLFKKHQILMRTFCKELPFQSLVGVKGSKAPLARKAR